MVAELCKCGHDLAAHTGSGVAGIPCNVCGVNRRGWPTGYCMGWDPPRRLIGYHTADGRAYQPEDVALVYEADDADVTGPAGATTPTEPPAGPHPFVGRQDRWCEQCHRPDRDPIHAPAGPPDLTHAIHAAAQALYAGSHWKLNSDDAARIAVQAAWPQMERDLRVAQTQIDQLRAFVDAAREFVHAEELDSSWSAPAWASLKVALAALDQAAPEQHP
jgi:hypothetical protein